MVEDIPKQIAVDLLVNKKSILCEVRKETVVEDIIYNVCKLLNITPVTKQLFGLKYHSNWLALNLKLWDLNIAKVEFRIRFKILNFHSLRKNDPVCFSYYYFQVRNDVLHNRVPDIKVNKHKDVLVGLGVTDMYRDISENDSSVSSVVSNYKKYLPSEVVKNHMFFVKKPMEQSLKSVMTSGVKDVSNIKRSYLESFEVIAPNYLIEDHEAVFMDSDLMRDVIVRVHPFLDEEEGILYRFLDSKEWKHISTIEDLCFISLRNDWSIEISRKTGIPVYMKFKSFNAAISFISLVDGYYRLRVKWTFNLCKDLATPSLQKLKRMKCHGPVGGTFSYNKLAEKRSNNPGSYILRESESIFGDYYLDVCVSNTPKPITYKIVTQRDDKVWFSGDQNIHDSLQALIDHYRDPENTSDPRLVECIPSSEYEESDLLLCRKPKSSNTHSKSESNEACVPRVIRLKNLQIFRGKGISGRHGFTVIHKCFWEKSKKTKVDVVLKVLKHAYQDTHLKDFLKLAEDWGCMQTSSFVKLLGVTLSEPYAMILEYFPLGRLDEYLSTHATSLEIVDLVEAAKHLADAVWSLEEEGIVHGYIRCDKLIVSSHIDISFRVKLSDPGLFETYSDFDYHWIPPELYHSPELIKRSHPSDMWAFGTTLWEIFSFGRKPSNEMIVDCPDKLSIFQYYRQGNRLPQPTKCPQEVYNLMCECWHADPSLRKKPQAAQRDINQHLYQVYNSRMRHSYATIQPKRPTNSGNTLDDVASEGFDTSSIHSQSTQLSQLSVEQSIFDDCSRPGSASRIEKFFKGSTMNDQFEPFYDNKAYSNDMSGLLSNLNIVTTTTSLGLSSLQSVLEVNSQINVVLQGKIGQGFYGEVYQGVIEDLNSDSTETQRVAIKRLRIKDDNCIIDFMREIEIMKALEHPNIVQMKLVVFEPEVNLVMEFVEHGSLKCYLSIKQDRLDPRRHILKYCLDIAKGMEHLGKMKIIHRDLAARNVLVADEFHVKISDFGLAQFMDTNNYYISQSNRELPIKWFAPESLRHGKFSTQSDVWSYGVTLYEMFTFGGEPNMEGMQEFSDKLLDALDRGMRLPKPRACPTEVYATLMAPCWLEEAHKRPSFTEIVTIVEELRQEKD